MLRPRPGPFFAQKRKKEGRSLNKYYLYNMDSRETFPEGRNNLLPKSLCSPRKKEKYTKEKRINIHFLQSRETPEKMNYRKYPLQNIFPFFIFQKKPPLSEEKTVASR